MRVFGFVIAVLIGIGFSVDGTKNSKLAIQNDPTNIKILEEMALKLKDFITTPDNPEVEILVNGLTGCQIPGQDTKEASNANKCDMISTPDNSEVDILGNGLTGCQLPGKATQEPSNANKCNMISTPDNPEVEILVNGLTGCQLPGPATKEARNAKLSSEFFSSSIPEAREDWERIVGGFKAPNGSIPYQVSLRLWGTWHFCGASLVTPRVILTAAHCVDRLKPQYFKAVVGTNQLRAGGTAYDIRKLVIHEDYDGDIIRNDIAILFTEKEMDFGSKVDAVELNDEPVEKGEELVLTGWGTTSYPGRLPNDLMQLELRSITYEECKEAHKSVNAVFETQICALTKTGEGACHGDSGGPLVREGRLIGIVSWGIPCARGKPDVYTKVEAFMRWIEKTLYDDDEDHVKYIRNLKHQRRTNRH